MLAPGVHRSYSIPYLARNADISAVSASVRPSSGILMMPMAHLPRAADRFEQELEDLDVAPRFVERRAPRIQAVASKQKRMSGLERAQRFADLARQPRHVLVVVDDRDPLPMHVRRDALKPFQHLVSLYGNACDVTVRGLHIRSDRAPNRVRVQDGACAADPGNFHVEQRFGGRLAAAPPDDRSFPIALEDVVELEPILR